MYLRGALREPKTDIPSDFSRFIFYTGFEGREETRETQRRRPCWKTGKSAFTIGPELGRFRWKKEKNSLPGEGNATLESDREKSTPAAIGQGLRLKGNEFNWSTSCAALPARRRSPAHRHARSGGKETSDRHKNGSIGQRGQRRESRARRGSRR